MTTISYAQNGEDILLWRALKDVSKGFYIDVGAHHPVNDSVTCLFYEQGWSGVNIEPVDEWFSILEQNRSRDINLKVALGAQKGEIELFEIPGTGLSTISEQMAKRHAEENGYSINRTIVPMTTLQDVCTAYQASQIHFIKIDVEGAEKDVLLGADFNNIRPWVIVIEATVPNSTLIDYESWEAILLNADYYFVFFDGLNRYYLSAEKWDELSQYFNAPVNILDHYVKYDLVMLLTKLKEAENNQATQEELIKKLSQEIDAANRSIGKLETALEQISETAKVESHQLKTQINDLTQLHNQKLAQFRQEKAEVETEYSSLKNKYNDVLMKLLEVSQLNSQSVSEFGKDLKLLVNLQNQEGNKQALHHFKQISESNINLSQALRDSNADYAKLEQSYHSLNSDFCSLQERYINLQQCSNELEDNNHLLSADVGLLRQKIVELKDKQLALVSDLENKNNHVDNLSQQLLLVKSSKSWIVTFPLRKALDLLNFLLKGGRDILKFPTILVLRHSIGKVIDSPERAARINRKLQAKLPFVHRHLRQFAIHRGLMTDNNGVNHAQPEPAQLTPVKLAETPNVVFDGNSSHTDAVIGNAAETSVGTVIPTTSSPPGSDATFKQEIAIKNMMSLKLTTREGLTLQFLERNLSKGSE